VLAVLSSTRHMCFRASLKLVSCIPSAAVSADVSMLMSAGLAPEATPGLGAAVIREGSYPRTSATWQPRGAW
jgi:hypothetical protein